MLQRRDSNPLEKSDKRSNLRRITTPLKDLPAMSAFFRTLIFTAIALFIPATAFASETAAAEGGHGGALPLTFLFIGVMLLFARFGALVERWGQPAVLGELVMGLALGALAFIPLFSGIEAFKTNEIILAFAEFGVLLLLFSTGLESNLKEMSKVGVPAFMVAILGVALPFAGGFFASKWLLPGLDFNTYLFIGATLTATSVGITARVFQDLKFSGKEKDIVLGAAVIDDILGLLILAVVGGLVSSGHFEIATVGILSGKAFAFLILSIAAGQILAPKFGALLSKIHTGLGMKMALALGFMVSFSWGAAELAGLAPIVGAFAAGLVLDPVHFKAFSPPRITRKLKEWAARSKEYAPTISKELDEEAHKTDHAHVEDYVVSISSFFVPIFFIFTGMQVNLAAFGDLSTVVIALVITAVAIGGKLVTGLLAGKGVNKWIIGFGMVPRGEVGLIFANVGKQLGVVNDQVFAVAVIMVILTTLVTPPILGILIKKRDAAEAAGATA